MTLPADLPTGSHTLIATGIDTDGNVLSQSLTFKVAAASLPSTEPTPTPAPEPGNPGWMSKTGPNVALVALAGLLLVAAGGVLLLVRRDP